MKPIEVGALVDFRVDPRDLTATLVDLAIRKYLRIIENDKKILMVKSKSYSLELCNKDWSGLNAWERELLGGLFGATGEITLVNLNQMATKLQSQAVSVKQSVETSLVTRGYFVSNPMKFLTVSLSTAGTVIVAAIIFTPIGRTGFFAAGLGVGAVVFATFYHFMAARTQKGVIAKEHIQGLKLYMEVAEKDRLKMLQSPNAPYATQADAPQRTVELFEKLLPYAIALQVENEWAKKFENIYKASPDWYAGNYAVFSTGYLIGSLSSGFNTVAGASFASSRSSSGSGFGGGGFSGGGGGGGGGW